MRQKRAGTMLNIKDKERTILTEGNEIMERWRLYCKELLEGTDILTQHNGRMRDGRHNI